MRLRHRATLEVGGPDFAERLATALVSGLFSLLGFALVWAMLHGMGMEPSFGWVLIASLVMAGLGFRFPRRFPRWLENVLEFCTTWVTGIYGRWR